MFWRLLFTHFLVFSFCHFDASSEIIGLQVVKHRHCGGFAGPSPHMERVRFPNHGTSIDDLNNGCIRIRGGVVNIRSHIERPDRLQVHLTMKIGSESNAEQCHQPRFNNCGGLGSCIHCNLCQRIEDTIVNHGQKLVEIFRGNERLKCESNVPMGQYNDISMNVCLPSKNEFLRLLDPNPFRAQKLWDTFAKRKNNGQIVGIPLLLFARVYNTEINYIAVNNPRRFQDMLYGSKEGMIGCHWLMVKVFEKYNTEL